MEHIEEATGRIIGKTSTLNQKSIKNKFCKGEVVFGKLRPYLRKYFYAEFDGVASSETWVLSFKNGLGDNKFLYYLIQSDAFIENCNRTTGTKMPRADWNYVSSELSVLPPLPEQRKIAAILTTWDKAIDKLELLIDKKQVLKKNLIRELCTRSIEEWKEYAISDVFEFISNQSFSRVDLTYEDVAEPILYFHYGDLHATYEYSILDCSEEKLIPKLLPQIELPSSTAYLQDGDLIIADASEDYEGVGECIEVSGLNGQRAIAGLHTFALRDTGGFTVDAFRPYILKSPHFVRALKRIATGSKVYGISKTNLAKLPVKLPSVEEQQKIAALLGAADKEIKNLKLQRDNLKEQKRGLMQVLLTGKVRVNVNGQ